ncbi:hypothetical protein [Marinobacter salsuginis]|uniref:hypothetical protein n=1 Tax=Marinobacter salsuginis TaxID=418719 RepID=UPI00273DBF59|nr:hypothetical protein [Marinobacter salsuginis]
MSDLFASVLAAIFEFITDIVLFVPRIVFWAALELLELAIGLLPPMDFFDPASVTSALSRDLVYFLTIMEFGTGIGFAASALVARFILRRIPLIG